MKPRRAPLAAPAVALALALSLTSCSGDDGPVVASDPAGGGAPAEAPQPPDVVPSAPGAVSSRGLATVIDTGDGAELCLGAVAESYPPQCSGPGVPAWDWADQRGMFEQQGAVRWGTFAVTGTWDGSSFGVTGAIPGALYDAVMPVPVELPEPRVDHSAEELQAISQDLSTLPGYQGSSVDGSGHVLTDVTYDDGTFQAYLDEAYGTGVVVLTAALVDAR